MKILTNEYQVRYRTTRLGNKDEDFCQAPAYSPEAPFTQIPICIVTMIALLGFVLFEFIPAVHLQIRNDSESIKQKAVNESKDVRF